jgi:hypothetical protein
MEFEQRWYDFNEIDDPETGHKRLVEDYHMLFVITPTAETFPFKLDMNKHF